MYHVNNEIDFFGLLKLMDDQIYFSVDGELYPLLNGFFDNGYKFILMLKLYAYLVFKKIGILI